MHRLYCRTTPRLKKGKIKASVKCEDEDTGRDEEVKTREKGKGMERGRQGRILVVGKERIGGKEPRNGDNSSFCLFLIRLTPGFWVVKAFF
jgi:hypothetical protein